MFREKRGSAPAEIFIHAAGCDTALNSGRELAASPVGLSTGSHDNHYTTGAQTGIAFLLITFSVSCYKIIGGSAKNGFSKKAGSTWLQSSKSPSPWLPSL